MKTGDAVWYIDPLSRDPGGERAIHAKPATFLLKRGKLLVITIAGSVCYARSGIFGTKGKAEAAIKRGARTVFLG